jgi:PAS domain S-box-containing protein
MADTEPETARAQRAREQIARAALEAVAEGGPLASVLELLCRTMEDESPDGVIACIHPLNEDATMFCDTAAPSLDKSYREATDGVHVSSMIGPCCYAVTTRQTVVVPDVMADPKWVKFLEYAQPLGLRSCWSKPILSNEGRVLGTFAHFYFEARDPSPHDERLVELLSRAAAVAIERRRAEAALRERNETLEQRVQAETRERLRIWNVSQDLLVIADLDGTILSVNPAWTVTLGWSETDLLGKSYQWLLHPDDQEKTRSEIDHLAKGKKTLHFENRLRATDGSYRWISWTAAPDSGRIYGTGRDITEQKRAEETLRESERSLRSTIDGIPGLVAILAPDGVVEAINRQIVDYCGLSLEGLKNWDTDGTIHHEDVLHLSEIFTASIASGVPYQVEARFRRVDGEYRWFDMRGIPVRDASDRITRWYVLLTDTEDRTQAVLRLQQMQSDFAHMNRVSMMGELSASLSHEILHPIATVRNNARAGMRFLELNPPNLNEAKDALGCVVRDADRAKDIVGRMRDHIKKAPPQREFFDLDDAVAEVIAMVRSAIARNGIVLSIDFRERPASVQADRVQLQQVILNLILNAIESMSALANGVRELTIRIEQGHADRRVLVQVRDSGSGIEPKNLERVFEPFYTTKSSGVGMGLSICRSIISGHGGRLWAEANEFRGAVFQFTLPRAEEGS